MTSSIDTLNYIEEQAQYIFDRWHEQNTDPELPTDPDTFQETFVDALEASAAGAPASLFPTLDDAEMTLIYNLIAARIYQLMTNPTITNDED